MQNDVKTQSLKIIDEFNNFTIVTQEDVDYVNKNINLAKQMSKIWYDKFDPSVKAAKKAHTLAVANRDKEVCTPLKAFIKLWTGNIALFLHKQAEITRKKEEEINAQLRKKAEKEVLAAQEQAKKDNIPAPVVMPTPQVVLAPQTVKPAGFVSRTTFHAEVIDFKALSDEFKVEDAMKLNRLASAYKGSNAPVGVNFYKKVNGVRVDEAEQPVKCDKCEMKVIKETGVKLTQTPFFDMEV